MIAVDAHKKSFTFVVLEDDEVVAGPARRPSNVAQVEHLVRKHPGHTVVVEACGVHEWMCDTWLGEGADVFVGRPIKQERKGDKNDGRDALLLGQRYLSGELKRVHHLDPETRLLRSVVRERCFLVGRRTQLVNHIKHELNRWNLHHLQMEKDEPAIVQALPHLASSFAVWHTLQEQIPWLEKRMREQGNTIEPVQRLQTIPGFGRITSLAFYTEVGDIHRFPTAQALVKYLGLDPTWRQSGDTRVDLHRISKAGRPLLRGLLVQAAWAHVRYAPTSPFTQKYHQLVKEKGVKGLAIVSVARRLAEAGHRVWRQNDDFTLIRPAPSVPSPTPA